MATLETKRRAFTLIELLVVVAIIALLISILLPALSRAKEQARIAKCLANMRSAAQAANAYLLEYNDLPWALRSPTRDGGRNYSFQWFTEFIWGGAMPNRTQDDYNQTGLNRRFRPSSADIYTVPPRLRPMNHFMAPSVSWDAEATSPPASPRAAPAEIPGNFVCPSDSSAAVPEVGQRNPQPEPDTIFMTWDFYGSSYSILWYWAYYYVFNEGGRLGTLDTLDVLGVSRLAAGYGPRFLRNVGGRLSSQYIVFTENGMNYALEGARPPGLAITRPWGGGNERKLLNGWHKQFSSHVASFLDGHAEHRRFDTRFVFGDGWSIWPNKPWDGRLAQYNTLAPTDQNAN